MPVVEDIAARHQRSRVTLARATSSLVRRMWSAIDPRNISTSWERSVPAAVAALQQGQLKAAEEAEPYLAQLTDAYGLPDSPMGDVRAAEFAAAASDGRNLSSLLYSPAVSALKALRDGATARKALASGRFTLDMIVRTQVADAGRVADGVALVARPQLGGWVRMLTTPSCGRCIILAGRFYQWDNGFQRHELCDCTHIPAAENVAGDLTTNPKAAFEAMSEAEQNEAFGVNAAQAIRDGADMNRVVNAGRSTFTAGGKKFANDSTTRRGSGRAVRLTPEQIYLEADGDRGEAVRLLRLHRYLT